MHKENNMTIGIYKLIFNGTDKVYIGQSTCIEKRWISHSSSLRLNSSSPKLQHAYNTYGLYGYEILCECDIEELDILEVEAIGIFNSYNNGFNSTPSATGPCLSGELNPSATETNDTYREILRLLIQKSPSFTKREISEICNTSIYTVRHIAALETHSWLKQDMPIEYSVLEGIKNTPYYRGTQYPLILSPSGEVFEVTHVTNFAKLHGLLQPKLTEVLRGTRNVHKGWKLYDPKQ